MTKQIATKWISNKRALRRNECDEVNATKWAARKWSAPLRMDIRKVALHALNVLNMYVRIRWSIVNFSTPFVESTVSDVAIIARPRSEGTGYVTDIPRLRRVGSGGVGMSVRWVRVPPSRLEDRKARPHILLGAIWFVVRMQCATTCLCTNVSCAWRMLRGPSGRWTRWSSTRGAPSDAHRAPWPSQSSGTSPRPAIKIFFPFVHCVFRDF